jgi:thiol:disulfide interchange protein
MNRRTLPLVIVLAFVVAVAAIFYFHGRETHHVQTAAEIAAAKAAHKPAIDYTPGKHIYPAIDQAPADVAAALAEAARTHKRVILDFGGDWCGDCQVLDIYFHESPNIELMDKYFIEVKVNIGQEDANLDIAHKYGVPVHGVPALAVLNSDGSVLVAQDKEFSDMRYMDIDSVTDFLNKWKS